MIDFYFLIKMIFIYFFSIIGNEDIFYMKSNFFFRFFEEKINFV